MSVSGKTRPVAGLSLVRAVLVSQLELFLNDCGCRLESGQSGACKPTGAFKNYIVDAGKSLLRALLVSQLEFLFYLKKTFFEKEIQRG